MASGAGGEQASVGYIYLHGIVGRDSLEASGARALHPWHLQPYDSDSSKIITMDTMLDSSVHASLPSTIHFDKFRFMDMRASDD